MKNTSVMKMNVPKFRGYDSSQDVYTFKSEFQRLIAPTCRTSVLPDYLKTNYLTGQALEVVRELDNIDEIWKRLLDSFGNVDILLNNKLSNVVKAGPLFKIRGDEKLVPVLTKMINGMKELVSLATKHGIEPTLFHRSNLSKIYDLVGDKRQMRYVQKCLDQELDIKGEWELIIEQLESELRLRERVISLKAKDKPSPDKPKTQNNDTRPKSNDSGAFAAGRDNQNPQLQNPVDSSGKPKCVLCGESDHIPTVTRSGRVVVHYFACQKFAEFMSPLERLKLLKDKGLCHQCLNPGRKIGHKGFCMKKFICPHDSHKNLDRGLHVLVCNEHKGHPENLELLKKYKETYIKPDQRDFSKNICILGFHVGSSQMTSYEARKGGPEHAIYQLQTIAIKGNPFNIFFDNGCGDFICRKQAVEILVKLGLAKKIYDGPLYLTGVGDLRTECDGGIYTIKIPLHDGTEVELTGLCLDKITGSIPKYSLKDAEKDVHGEYRSQGGDPAKLPKVSLCVGGETDFMIGMQYLKYFPKEVFQIESGLTLYESKFKSHDGSRGIICGPHKSFTDTNMKVGSHVSMRAYFTKYVRLYQCDYRLRNQVSLIGATDLDLHAFEDVELLTDDDDCTDDILEDVETPDDEILDDRGDREDRDDRDDHTRVCNCSNSTKYEVLLNNKPIKCLEMFEQIEATGTEITYRCVRCRGCLDCKSSLKIDCVSLEEEVEQSLIEKSVTIELKDGKTIARLPFLYNPVGKLAPNRGIARKIYDRMVRKLDDAQKAEIIDSEAKMQQLGFVDYLDNLTPEQLQKILDSEIMYFLLWRIAYNDNSLSTSCRMVFDASHPTKTGHSLNSLLAKGRNNMNKLVEMFIRWAMRRVGYHTDIRKMYNSLWLVEEHWCYQLYLWQEDLDPTKEPRPKVVKSIIYGVKPSGNQAEYAIRQTGELMKEEYPRQCEVINNDYYVDDCISGEDTLEMVNQVTDGLKVVLNSSGFDIKGVSVTGADPPEHLKNADNSVNVPGMKWFTKIDSLSLNIGELNFGKRVRGRKPVHLKGIIPDKFSRKDCASQVGGVFDIRGFFVPITAGFKVDLKVLTKGKYAWTDFIPDDLKGTWISNFELIRQLGDVMIKRAVVPDDAVSLDIETLELGDASEELACSVIYGRFLLKSGEYSCQFLFSRSKILSEELTMPRAELIAAVLNASSSHVVYLSLDKFIKRRYHLSDSQIVLYWLNNSALKLKKWVRSRVIEALRLTDKTLWFYIESSKNMADLGTRKGATLEDVGESSEWMKGQSWTRLPPDELPIKSVSEIKLSEDEEKLYNDECLVLDEKWINQQLSSEYSQTYVAQPIELDSVAKRYQFSQYIVDPNRFRLRKVIRIVALVYLFIRKLQMKTKGKTTVMSSSLKPVPSSFKNNDDTYLVTKGNNSFPFKCTDGLTVTMTDEILQLALDYYFKKGTAEIKHFLPKTSYRKISEEKDGVLLYSGRILPSQQFGGSKCLSDVCVDLTAGTFCVPLIDKFSPLAYALINEVHWYDPDAMHSGNETVSRHVQLIAYIIEGKSLVRRFRTECPRCRILNKRALKVIMGPISDNNLCIAPAFFVSQCDICGPFSSYSNVNKRASCKIWFVIFCCCTTGAVDVKLMEDYSTTSFILAFVRFSCKVGYPKKLLPDAGSQLLKGCQEMVLEFHDIKTQLHKEFGVEFDTCPVGAHYMHGRVERKIRHIRESFSKSLNNDRLSMIQWETLGDQVANTINNLPIALGNTPPDIESIDLLTPNRLMLARNNSRCPVGTVDISDDPKKIIFRNNEVFDAWFKTWLVSHVPTLIPRPKWHDSSRDPKVGDVILFLKSEKEFENKYQYGIINSVKLGSDGKIRSINIMYQNHNETTKRYTTRGTREIVVVHLVDELGIISELNQLTSDLKESGN